MEYSELKPT